MLAQVGYGSLDELTSAAVPDVIKSAEALNLPGARTEADVLAELRTLADRNQVLAPMIGLGYYGTFTPPVILRNVMESPAWYTAYTPYQPEISQGRLEALLNFQTMVADLTGLPTSGASLLDEATAAAEAMSLARRVGKVKDGVFLVDADALPQTLAVIRTRAEPTGVEVVTADLVRAFRPRSPSAASSAYCCSTRVPPVPYGTSSPSSSRRTSSARLSRSPPICWP